MRNATVLRCIAASLVFVCGFAAAQSFPTDKGSKLVTGGGVFFSAGGDLYESSDGDRLTSIQLTPSYSTFIAPGIALGGKLLLVRQSQGDNSSTFWSIGPHIIYFIGGDKPKEGTKGTMYPYVGASFLYGHHTTKYEYYGETEEFPETNLSFGGGIIHMLTPKAGLLIEAGYQIDRLYGGYEDSEGGNKFNVIAGLAVFL